MNHSIATTQQELHARPFPIVQRPATLWYAAQYHEQDQDIAAQLAECRKHFPAAVIHDSSDRCQTYTGESGTLIIEQHHEFYSYIWISATNGEAFPSLDDELKDWFNALPGEQLTRIQLQVLPSAQTTANREELVPLLGDHQLCGAFCSDGAAAVWTSFQTDDAGWNRYLIHDLSLNSDRRCGRLCQRLVESEVYRILCLMSLEPARALQKQLDAFEQRLSHIISLLNNPSKEQEDKHILEQLTGLAIDVEEARAHFAQRASASQAYGRIYRERLAELRQEKIPRFQLLSEFLKRRVDPALHSIEHSAQRLEQLSLRLDRSGVLLRTRVDITLEEQNTQLLHSLDKRAEAQLQLQETVEGLSVVAISYYLVGLCAYLLSGIKSLGTPINKDLALIIIAPIIVFLVYKSVRRIRAALQER